MKMIQKLLLVSAVILLAGCPDSVVDPGIDSDVSDAAYGPDSGDLGVASDMAISDSGSSDLDSDLDTTDEDTVETDMYSDPDLNDIDMGDADMSDADMSDADMRDADMRDADMGDDDVDMDEEEDMNSGPPPYDTTGWTMKSEVISDSASTGTPDSYFYQVDSGSPLSASITGGGSGIWSVNVFGGLSNHLYCTGSSLCQVMLRPEDTTVVVTAITTGIGSYTLTIQYSGTGRQ